MASKASSPSAKELLFSPHMRCLIIGAQANARFDLITPQQQRETVSKLERVIELIEARDEDMLREWGIEADGSVKDVLDQCYWQMVQNLKYSDPTRIQEAVPYCERVLEYYAETHGTDAVDVTPTQTLAVGLSKTPGREEDALYYFELAFNTDLLTHNNSSLWARAHWSRLLRRVGRIAEAEEQEEWLRCWILGRPYSMPPSQFIALVSEEDESENYILDHPDMNDFGADVDELPEVHGMQTAIYYF